MGGCGLQSGRCGILHVQSGRAARTRAAPRHKDPAAALSTPANSALAPTASQLKPHAVGMPAASFRITPPSSLLASRDPAGRRAARRGGGDRGEGGDWTGGLGRAARGHRVHRRKSRRSTKQHQPADRERHAAAKPSDSDLRPDHVAPRRAHRNDDPVPPPVSPSVVAPAHPHGLRR